MGNKFYEGHETFYFPRAILFSFLCSSQITFFILHTRQKVYSAEHEDIELLIRIYENLLYFFESHLHFIPSSLPHIFLILI